MASTRCLQAGCGNRTLDPSGYCFLHVLRGSAKQKPARMRQGADGDFLPIDAPSPMILEDAASWGGHSKSWPVVQGLLQLEHSKSDRRFYPSAAAEDDVAESQYVAESLHAGGVPRAITSYLLVTRAQIGFRKIHGNSVHSAVVVGTTDYATVIDPTIAQFAGNSSEDIRNTNWQGTPYAEGIHINSLNGYVDDGWVSVNDLYFGCTCGEHVTDMPDKDHYRSCDLPIGVPPVELLS